MPPLPRPGLVGRAIRVVLALALFSTFEPLFGPWLAYWSGPVPTSSQILWVAAVAVGLSSWVVNELFQKDWGSKPSMATAAAAAGAAAVAWGVNGSVFAPPFGIVLWSLVLALVVVLGPAHLLAAILGTPGCEMRSYADLWTRVRGGDPAAVACPGWIDRFDGVRLPGERRA